jgi:hypothetical protein
MRKIEVTIGLDGSVKMDAQGFKGKTCEEATDQLMLLLVGEGESKKKPDYFQPPVTSAVGVKRVF